MRHLTTVRLFCRKRDWPTEGGLRWLIFNSKKNGFDKCIVRMGRRVLIDETMWDEYIEEHREVRIELVKMESE